MPKQLVILLFTTVIVDTVVLSSYAFFAQRGLQSFRQSRLSVWLQRALGATLVFFGFKLLLSRK
ncbi:MAG: LysE family transporter [Limisphaerales bacterium]